MSRTTYSADRCYCITTFCDSYRMGKLYPSASLINQFVQAVMLLQRVRIAGTYTVARNRMGTV